MSEVLIITLISIFVTSVLGVTGVLLMSTIKDFKGRLTELTEQFNRHNVLLTKVFEKLEVNTERYNKVEVKSERTQETIDVLQKSYANLLSQIELIHNHIRGCKYNNA